jgi:hypothetical protein
VTTLGTRLVGVLSYRLNKGGWASISSSDLVNGNSILCH